MNHICPSCHCSFKQEFLCTTCGAEKLKDESARQLERALHSKAEALMSQTNEIESLRAELETTKRERDEYNTARLALIERLDKMWDEREALRQERINLLDLLEQHRQQYADKCLELIAFKQKIDALEPVGYFCLDQYGPNCLTHVQVCDEYKDDEDVFPLYTHPAPAVPEGWQDIAVALPKNGQHVIGCDKDFNTWDEVWDSDEPIGGTRWWIAAPEVGK